MSRSLFSVVVFALLCILSSTKLAILSNCLHKAVTAIGKCRPFKSLQNKVINGDFEVPQLKQDQQILNIPGGTAEWVADTLQIGRGSLYNERWKKSKVTSLDSNGNQDIRQTIGGLKNGQKYDLYFSWAATVDHLESSAGVCKWNGVTVVIMNPSDLEIHKAFVTVESKEGGNVLEFVGTSTSDSYGLTVGKVQLLYSKLNPKRHK